MKQSQKLPINLIEPYFANWQALKEELQEAHKLRSTKTASLMAQGTQLFTALLAECGGEVKILNGQDRLDFITSHASKYAAFRQLDELFVGLKKSIASKRVQLNRGN